MPSLDPAPTLDLDQQIQQLATEWLKEEPELAQKVRRVLFGSEQEVIQGVVEALKFIWLVAHKDSDGTPKPAVLTPAHRVDLVWHEMILFTRRYEKFCQSEFGQFIHHQPGGSAATNRQQFQRTISAYRKHFGSPPDAFWGTNNAAESACGACETFDT